MTSNFRNDHYSENKTVYGENPNEFFKEQLLKLKPGRFLLPAEGRNAIFYSKAWLAGGCIQHHLSYVIIVTENEISNIELCSIMQERW